MDMNVQSLDKLLARNGLGLRKPKRTEKQVETSRRNGSRSQGPITLAGKQKASRNAVRLGIFCKTIPEYRYPLYYSQEDVSTLAADIGTQLGCRSTFSRSLAESMAIDVLRLRHIRALEHALLDPDIERDHELERALRQKRGECVSKSEADRTVLLDAATKVRDSLAAGTPISLAICELDILVGELWTTMNGPRRNLEKARRELASIDGRIKAASTEEAEGLQVDRGLIEEDLHAAEAQIRTRDLQYYGIETEDDILAVLTNAKPVPPDLRAVWVNLMADLAYDQTVKLKQMQDGRLRIESLRRDQLLQSLNGLDRLTQLADYAARIQKHMERTLAMLRDVEGLSVIDV